MNFVLTYKEIIIIIIPAAILFFTGKTLLSRKNKKMVANNMLYNVYLPIYKEIEPYLYKELSHETGIKVIRLVNTLADKYYELFNPTCLQAYKSFRNNFFYHNKKNDTSYEEFCYLIERDYEKLKRELHLPRETFLQRLTGENGKFQLRMLMFELLEKFTSVLFIISVGLIIIMFLRLLLIFYEFVIY
ncbi:hypothetical protein ACERII_16160 [Evansella sp. AB-rgal1]|uniref:hypothetical protein n=1 Tax=Evansella sp. AB-rgal1 TaxID=3242696 RepID=UPI00359EDFE7